MIDESDVVVIGNAGPEFAEAITRCRPDQTILDLVRVPVDRAKVVGQLPGHLLVEALSGARLPAHGDDAKPARASGAATAGRVVKSQPMFLPSVPAFTYGLPATSR